MKSTTAKTFVVAGLMLVGLLASASPASAAPAGVTPNIVGGHDATGTYPAMASLQYRLPDNTFTHICGASLVYPLYVVTGAHCVTNSDGTAMDPSLFQLRIGSRDRTSGGIVTKVTKVLPNANWDWGAGGDRVADIALLRLATPVLQVPFIITPAVSQTATTRMLGWGSTQPDAGGPYPSILKELDTTVLPQATCAPAGITEGELCVDGRGGQGICVGDSGGPALQPLVPGFWMIIGGTSRGAGTACGDAVVVATDYTYYRLWIWQVIATGQVPPREQSAAGTPSATLSTSMHWL